MQEARGEVSREVRLEVGRRCDQGCLNGSRNVSRKGKLQLVFATLAQTNICYGANQSVTPHAGAHRGCSICPTPKVRRGRSQVLTTATRQQVKFQDRPRSENVPRVCHFGRPRFRGQRWVCGCAKSCHYRVQCAPWLNAAGFFCGSSTGHT